MFCNCSRNVNRGLFRNSRVESVPSEVQNTVLHSVRMRIPEYMVREVHNLDDRSPQMNRTTTFTTALYALFVAGFAAVVTRPSLCVLPVLHSPAQLPSFWTFGIPFVLQTLFVGLLLRRGRFVLNEGWCAQAVVWPLLLTGLAGVAMSAGCGLLEQAWPTLDTFAAALHGSIWALRSKLALVGGLVGVVLFHVCARRVPAAGSAPAA